MAVMTQVILMLSQLVLLPLQVRLWGQSSTALWYAALALATVTYVVDCGLRTAGHSELIRANADPLLHRDEYLHFLQIWSWIRVLIIIVTVGLVFFDFVMDRVLHSAPYPAWRLVLIVACALETVLVIRITFLDSLGLYRGAEASYFFFAVLRLALSLPALLFFNFTSGGLAAIYLLTAASALLAQGRFLCSAIPLLQLTAKFPKLSWSVLALARHTVAEPVANWARLSLPVLIIGQIAAPVAVTTYVALRAVFGAGRTTVQQLARVASVEVLRLRSLERLARSTSFLTLFLVCAVLFGSCVGLFVIIDNMRILGLWLKHFDRPLFQQIALAFALTAPFFSYQIPMNLLFRTGSLAWVARRHYSFAVYSALFAGLSLMMKSLPLYLGLLVIAEITLSATFFVAGREETVLKGTRSGAAALQSAALCSLTIFLFWVWARQSTMELFSKWSFAPMLESALLLLATILVLITIFYARYVGIIHSIRSPDSSTPVLAVAE